MFKKIPINLYEANLHDANLTDADLRRADLRRADLQGADFTLTLNINEATFGDNTGTPIGMYR